MENHEIQELFEIDLRIHDIWSTYFRREVF